MRVVALPHGDRRAERRDLREREVDEDDPSLDDVQPEIGVNAGDDQARGDRRRQELQECVQSTASYFPVDLLERAPTAG